MQGEEGAVSLRRRLAGGGVGAALRAVLDDGPRPLLPPLLPRPPLLLHDHRRRRRLRPRQLQRVRRQQEGRLHRLPYFYWPLRGHPGLQVGRQLRFRYNWIRIRIWSKFD